MMEFKSPGFPFNGKSQELEALVQSLDTPQLIWLHGYIQGSLQSRQIADPPRKLPDTGSIPVTVLYGTHSGNSRKIASALEKQLVAQGHTVHLEDLANYKPKNIRTEKYIFLVVSTQGEGNPPLAAEEFYEYLHGNRVQAFHDLKYAILGLGDKSYIRFCQTAVDLDARLEQLGGKRILPLVKCDTDFSKPSETWIGDSVAALGNIKPDHAAPAIVQQETESFRPSREHPIEARIINRIKLTGRGSEKNTYHLEIELPSEDITYDPGDSLGIIPENGNELVQAVISHLNIPDGMVTYKGITGSLHEIMVKQVELTRLTRENLEQYRDLTADADLDMILKDDEKLSLFIATLNWADLLKRSGNKINLEDFLPLLRPIQPRLYSIASSVKSNPGEVHIIVNQLFVDVEGEVRKGVCSTFLSEFPEDSETIMIFFEQNEVFKLPAQEKDIIMIGPGTGIAPFRAFMQEREATGAPGKNWLFFGERRFTTDFYYQTEWQEWHRKSLLHRVDLAFSRDQKQKVYVQHRMRESSKELFSWLENGASVYVCGDRKNMAVDVNRTLVEIIGSEGGISVDKAKDYLKKLRREKRYVEDVY